LAVGIITREPEPFGDPAVGLDWSVRAFNLRGERANLLTLRPRGHPLVPLALALLPLFADAFLFAATTFSLLPLGFLSGSLLPLLPFPKCGLN
jgi:hypothetical protein